MNNCIEKRMGEATLWLGNYLSSFITNPDKISALNLF